LFSGLQKENRHPLIQIWMVGLLWLTEMKLGFSDKTQDWHVILIGIAIAVLPSHRMGFQAEH
jgi:hypothetical protein